MENNQKSNPVGKFLQSAGAWIGNIGSQVGLNYLSALQQQRFQKRAEQRSNAEWWERFNAMNRYNSPENQAKLITKAGGNPLSLFSNGYSPNPVNPTSPSFSNPAFAGVNTATANEAALIQSQVNLNNANAEKALSDVDVNKSEISLNSAYEEFTKQQTLSEEQLTRLRTLEADIQEATKGTQIQTYITALEKMQAEVKSIDQNTEYYRQLTFQVELARVVEQFNLDYLLPAQLQNINADTKVKLSQANLNNKEVEHLTHLESKDKHELYLAYQRFAKEYGYTTFQYDLSEKNFDDIIEDFVIYTHDSDKWPDDGLESRRVSVEESKATFHQTAASVLAFIAALGSLKGKLGSWATDFIKKIGKSLRF